MRGGLDSFRKLGFQPKEIRLIGGGAKSSLWRQITADILNVPIRIPQLEEAAALGAAVQALWCIESVKDSNCTAKTAKETMQKICASHISLDTTKKANPILSNVEQYDIAYTQYTSLVQALSPLYK